MNKEQGLQFLSELVDKINTQNNRGTAAPYFYVIKTKRWRVPKDDYTHGETYETKYDHEMRSEYKLSQEEEYKSYCIEAGYCDTHEEAQTRWDDLETHTMEAYEEEDNVFFTEAAFDEHVRLNGHNLGRHGEYYSYVKHAFRNPELNNLLSAIAAVTEKELCRK